MIQSFNGVKLLVKVIEYPSRELVQRAMRMRQPICITVASYSECLESVGTIELVDVKSLIGSQNGFSFSGRIARVDIGAAHEDASQLIAHIESGNAKVRVDDEGADIQFVINLTMHFL